MSKVFSRPLPWLRRILRRPPQQGVVALQPLNLELKRGEIFGLVGRNGQGKTTLIKIIAGLIEPTTGAVKVYGFDPIERSSEVRQKIGLVTSDERSFYWRLTGRQNLEFFARLHGFSKRNANLRIEALAKTFELTELLPRRFNVFSAGNKQRLSLVRALLTDPHLLLLDEPTRSLDPISADKLRGFLLDWVKGAPDRSVLITTHNLGEIESLCGRVGILSQNELVECASLPELRKRYAGPDRVSLDIRRVENENCLIQIRARVPELIWKSASPGVYKLSFPNGQSETHLDFVLTKLMEAKAEVVGCETIYYGLNRIMSDIEQRGHSLR